MREHLLEEVILHADETIIQWLSESGRAAESKSYMWLYRNGRGRPPNILFEYQRTRASKHPKKFLSDFKGYLHVDGYGDTIAYQTSPYQVAGAMSVDTLMRL